MAKVSREKFKVYQNVFDGFTLRTLFKLHSQGYFDWELSPVKKGKESSIFSSVSENEQVIIKIHRPETSNFNKMYDYIKTDPRFSGLHGQKRKLVFAWSKREYQNLLKAWDLTIPVPKPITQLNHILVMGFIGDEEAAPMLKDSPPQDLTKFAEKTIISLKKLRKAGFVHGDLSEYNILNFKETPYFIDFTQSTTLKNPQYEELFSRDIKIISSYFKKQNFDIEKKLLNILR